MTIEADVEMHSPPPARSLRWMELAARQGQVGFWRSDLATGVIECTATCKMNIGFPVDQELTLARFREQIDPQDAEAVSEAIAQAIADRASYATEYRVRWPDGSEHWIASRGSFIDSAPRGALIGTTHDITELKLIERELEKQRDLNAVITHNAAEGLCFIDASGGVTFMNAAAERIIGWPADEMLGKKIHDVVHARRPNGAPYPAEECPLAGTLASGEAVSDSEDWWLHRDGHFICVMSSSRPIVENGVVRGAVVSLHDMSERRRMEDALRDANRAKDEFLATISHELRTPMTAVIGWLQYLQMLPLSAEIAEVVGHAAHSALAQADIVDDLLDVSRAVTGKLRLHLAVVDLEDAANIARRNIESSAAAKKIRLVMKSNGPLQVPGDPTRVQQVISNLLTNAVKFSYEGSEIVLELERREEHAIIRVRDNGIGIDAEFLPFIFDRFSQASTAATRASSGLGLGLAIVKQLVELHHGSVHAASEGRGHGATFTVLLPLPNTP